MASTWMGWLSQLCSRSFVIISAVLAVLFLNEAKAQIVRDTTLGSESSIVTPNGLIFNISGGATRGTNLFHSFEQFSIPTNGAAFFNNAVDIQNIISRVTGGNGGRVNITSRGIFGIESRPRPTGLSDITARSSGGVDGEVTLNTPDVDPSRGIIELPENVFELSNLIASGCIAFGGSDGSKFIVTGRGGLPPNPYEPLDSDVVWSDTRVTVLGDRGRGDTGIRGHGVRGNATVSKEVIVPATGWVFNDKGEVTLIASDQNVNFGSKEGTCRVR